MPLKNGDFSPKLTHFDFDFRYAGPYQTQVDRNTYRPSQCDCEVSKKRCSAEQTRSVQVCEDEGETRQCYHVVTAVNVNNTKQSFTCYVSLL